ncbi:MAG: nucleotidyl transferase AbiEii/AbiGii toxin family protein [Acidobacteriota bacterium]|nr:nucleotidyl transferase AbiEii/AbiGii toxin family protein [Acidobacteriota bacterium]
MAREPVDVMPAPVGRAVADLPYWFVIGGQAMRCFCPYRPSRDVDFGVTSARDLDDLVQQLQRRGRVEIAERSADTVHLRFDGIDVSIFVLVMLSPFVTERRLSVTGLLATKLHAILDRGTRRDFFDLYVTLHRHALGIAECLAAMRQVYRQDVNELLLLRALTFFDDAEREAALPGEGPDDWATVKEFFWNRVGQLLIPPARELQIERRVVDVTGG